MRFSIIRNLILVLAVIVVCVSSWSFGFDLGKHQLSAQEDDSLKIFLRRYLANSRSEKREPTRYSAALLDLKGDGKREVIVYISGSFYCGTGGCTTLILAPKASSFRVLSKIFTSRTPIRVLETGSHGWHDISVTERGGYGGEGPYAYEGKISFNGKSYRLSVGGPAASEQVEKIPGEVLISVAEQGKLLF
jgi:hypothetical protein